ncbi:MAG: sulfatase-like hydrolase/transferase [Chloroflexota bacterium]
MNQVSTLTRREILKLLSLSPLLALPGSTNQEVATSNDSNLPNIVVLVFDAWSARHMPFYGYPRNTMPNLSKFLERATVYHSHHSAALFTSPGTASILTSRYPWNHRAFNFNGEIIKGEVSNNIFSALAGTPYTRMGFSQNPLAIFLLDQFSKDLEKFPMPDETALIDYVLSDNIFGNDFRTASVMESSYLRPHTDTPLSFVLSLVEKYIYNQDYREFNAAFKEQYPLGPVAHQGRSYLMPEIMDWVRTAVNALPKPSFSYIHLFPPHDPTRPSAKFLGSFNDSWSPLEKPHHHFSAGFPQDELNRRRQLYDEYIAYLDEEFGKVLTSWDEDGVLENTILMITSDHGEMFERGIYAHSGPALFQPVIQVPLIIAEPGQTTRKDIYTPTSSVDLLPTIMQLGGQPIPSWCEGRVLPPYGGAVSERSIFAADLKTSAITAPIVQGSFAVIRKNYKLNYFMGYEMGDASLELYDLENDPEEMENLASRFPEIANSMKAEIDRKIEESNKLYQR